MTFRATDPAPDPLSTLGVNHAAFSARVQVSEPAPVLLMLIVWETGLLAPCIAVYDRLVALKPIVGVGAAVTESMTAID